jgi:hypothetical protein
MNGGNLIKIEKIFIIFYITLLFNKKWKIRFIKNKVILQ